MVCEAGGCLGKAVLKILCETLSKMPHACKHLIQFLCLLNKGQEAGRSPFICTVLRSRAQTSIYSTIKTVRPHLALSLHVLVDF